MAKHEPIITVKSTFEGKQEIKTLIEELILRAEKIDKQAAEGYNSREGTSCGSGKEQ